ncbi:MAG: NAD(P)H-binding protein [Nakamurella sp.]
MDNDIWVLGANGRSGSGIARRLRASGHSVVLAGRDPARLGPIADEIGAVVISGSFESLLEQLSRAAPAVVVSTIGPFATTSAQVIEALPAGTNYVDIGNELPGAQAVLDGHQRAVADRRTVVTGAGFGVLATESVVLRLCEGRPAPAKVRVDAIPSLATEKGVIGAALAGSMLDSAPDGGRHVEHGRLARFPVVGARQQLTTPTGDIVTTAALPTGDLLAAWRASNADSVISATSAIPSGPAVRVAFPVLSVLMRWSALRRFAIGRVARIPMPERARPREFSWGHAKVEWNDGTSREGWLRLGDAQQFTETATAEVARRLLGQQVAAGAYTPGALFGAALAADVGGEFFL